MSLGNIYRYVSFESFVNIIQKQSLAFVLPDLWEDPFELYWFNNTNTLEEDQVSIITHRILKYKTFAQSWTRLSESDAMWRIYSHNNKSIRIKINTKDIKLLDDVQIKEVRYSNDFDSFNLKNGEDFLQVLALKRKSFEHEKELRLIKYYKFHDMQDAQKKIEMFLAIAKPEKYYKLIDNLFPNLEIESQINNICEILNLGKNKKTTIDVSFSHIEHFIKGVLVHPQAEDWYVNTVSDFCKINNIEFEGKSKLYTLL